ncbi:uncharacterized protein ASPGLDRAFT_125469 [Aspergillus glaucus CBS 516.65]|uniref:Cyclin-D1-binding protein 1-like N-terminal domain-containing protein n=1 Tax=Aspergillus glaucus CBS 516.65 TaxID=1160497 RepID=A0A1L9VLT1_ASPGL|nr:hypothetical protein ASPGLDRAFT_125469 [Aspergillus glaucus CBS 516.65]OJJ84855.1 hypothetical protein ASPGLDRAFT_125469 [Aspergillus glaucus CBS 516.65]
MSQKLSLVLTTTLTLLDQFQTAIYSPPQKPAPNETDDAKRKDDALSLLTASSHALHSQVTKLSLLTITAPFTHSAVCTVLSALNESVLPSLVTAALLVNPDDFTKAFHAEVQILAKAALKELAALIGEVKGVADKKNKAQSEGKKEEDLSQAEKDVVTVATGRVWDACDVLVDVATKGVVGFVIRRVEQWRDLVKDAVEEIEEWDPDEDDDFFDDLLGEDEKNAGDYDDDEDDGDEEDTAASHARKKSTLRILKPVAQVFPAISTNRLKNAGNAPVAFNPGVRKLESLMVNLQSIPDDIDEVAGALYEENWERHTQFLGKVKDNAAKAVGLVKLPWGAAEGTEDKFTTWSKTWLKVVDEVSKSIDEATS